MHLPVASCHNPKPSQNPSLSKKQCKRQSYNKPKPNIKRKDKPKTKTLSAVLITFYHHNFEFSKICVKNFCFFSKNFYSPILALSQYLSDKISSLPHPTSSPHFTAPNFTPQIFVCGKIYPPQF